MEHHLDGAAIARLDGASEWLITDMAGELYRQPAIGDQIQSELIDRFKVTSYNKPALERDTGTPRFIPKSRGIYYDISVVATQSLGSRYFEYWFIAVTPQAWASDQAKRCWFLVTEAAAKTSTRRIHKKEPRFFDRYEIDGREVFNLSPQTDFKLRYRLTPWLLPDCFEHFPALVHQEVVILQDGSYELRPFAAEANR